MTEYRDDVSAKIKWVAYDYGLRIILKNLTLVILRRQVKNYFHISPFSADFR